MDAPAPRPDPATLEADPSAWDGFVASTALAPYLQATAWAEVKARNGWSARRVVVGGPAGTVGCQLLTHRIGPLRWSVGYAPRGPVTAGLDEEAIHRSVRRTGRCVVVDESWPVASVGSHLAYLVSRECFDRLDAPVELVSLEDVPMPYNRSLELAAGPGADKIVAAALRVLYLEPSAAARE